MRSSFIPLVFFIFIGSVFVYSQGRMSKAERIFQDGNSGGIGPMAFNPQFGGGALVSNPWIGVSMVSDIMEFRYAMGESSLIQPLNVDPTIYNVQPLVNVKEYGHMVSAGVNFPLPFLTVGTYVNDVIEFRGHPTFGAHIGWFGFGAQKTMYSRERLYFLSVSPGYRLKLPFGSAEINCEARIGKSFSKLDRYYKGVAFYPTLTFRIDAFKRWLDPVEASGRFNVVDYSNVNTTVHQNVRITSWTETVRETSAGLQDVGPYFGIGPKIGAMNPKRTLYTNPSLLVGLVAEGRRNGFDYGFTLEGGEIGHGSVIEYKSENKPRRKLERKNSIGAGTIKTVNLYSSLGIDLSQMLFLNGGETTTFLGVSAGLILGGHYSFDQKYDVGFDKTEIEKAKANNDLDAAVDNKFVDPSDVGYGFLSGFYVSVNIGAVTFKTQSYRYYGAPFAGTGMLSIAWKIPVSLHNN